MNITESSFENRHGLNLYRRSWIPGDEARACVIIVHGMAEHCARYDRLAAACNERGYAVCALDLPGHGHSEGPRTYVNRFSDHADSVEDLLQQVQQEFPGKPLFIVGHSMGGLVVTNLLLSRQDAFKGAILSGPALLTPLQPPAWQLLLIRLFSFLVPRMGVMQLDANGVSRDPAVVADYIADPLNYGGKICARTVAELFPAMNTVDEWPGITLPLLLLHGGEDSMTAPEGSRLLHDKAGSPDKTLHIYPGLYHEIFNEPEHQEIFTEVLDWLDQH